MSYFSSVTYLGNGTTRSYAVPFPYISPDHVQVKINGTLSSAWTFTDPGTILLGAAATSGASIQVSRNTPRDGLLVEFSDTSVLTETDLLLSATQNLYCVQEIADQSTSVLDAAKAYTDMVRATLEPLAGLSPTAIAADLANTRALTAEQRTLLDALSATLNSTTASIRTDFTAADAAEKTQRLADTQTLNQAVAFELSQRSSGDAALGQRIDGVSSYAVTNIAALTNLIGGLAAKGTFVNNNNGTYYARIPLGNTTLQIGWGLVGLGAADGQAWSYGCNFSAAAIAVAQCQDGARTVVVNPRDSNSGFAWAYDKNGNIAPNTGFNFIVVGIV